MMKSDSSSPLSSSSSQQSSAERAGKERQSYGFSSQVERKQRSKTLKRCLCPKPSVSHLSAQPKFSSVLLLLTPPNVCVFFTHVSPNNVFMYYVFIMCLVCVSPHVSMTFMYVSSTLLLSTRSSVSYTTYVSSMILVCCACLTSPTLRVNFTPRAG